MPPSRHPDWEPITAYVADTSYFSGKMEAYLRYKEIPYERRLVDSKLMRDEVLPATGLMKVPVLRLANGDWLRIVLEDGSEGYVPSRLLQPKLNEEVIASPRGRRDGGKKRPGEGDIQRSSSTD